VRPIALAVGSRKGPIFGICPVKSVIGDYKPAAPAEREKADERKAAAQPARDAAKRKPGSNRKGARARRPRK
jgi:hypothetical protein